MGASIIRVWITFKELLIMKVSTWDCSGSGLQGP